ncbi:MAG: IS110 family transposase [Nitrospira sp.]|nr:IS110 family transposase [Nitrospira sp.]
MTPPQVFVGIEVSTSQMDVALRPEGRFVVANDETGCARLVERLRAVSPTLVVLEATGGYEIPVTGALAAAQITVVVNPRPGRDVAKATGTLAKTDALDAQPLAHFAEVIRPARRPLPDELTQALAALVTRRRQRVDMLTAEKNRLRQASTLICPRLKAHLTWLERAVQEADTDLAEAIRQSPRWRENDARLRSAPGVGPVLTTTLLATVPERGTLTHKQISALVGGAPCSRDRGLLRGKRPLGGGRAQARAVLSMGAIVATRFNPVSRAFDQRLGAAGKANKVALTACMRKLLVILTAMLKQRPPWRHGMEPAWAGA